MESLPKDKVYRIVSAIFAGTHEISAVWKEALKLTPEKSIRQITPEALPYLHPGAARFFREKGALKGAQM